MIGNCCSFTGAVDVYMDIRVLVWRVFVRAFGVRLLSGVNFFF